MTNWGTIILNACKKSRPLLLNGMSKASKFSKFSLSNPYVLESVPEELLKTASIFEGKKLNTVCRIIDNPQIIERYNKFCQHYTNLAKVSPNDYLAELYKKSAFGACKPEIFLDFSTRAKIGEFKGQDLYSKIIDGEYNILRKTNEYTTEYRIANISDITGKSTSKIKVNEHNHWHYRLSKSGKPFKSTYRISINAKGNENVIKSLDDFVNEGRYYKTPNNPDDWLERHDPITIYFKNKPTKEEIKDLVKILKDNNAIRSTENVLPGKQIIPGVALQTSPSKQDVITLIQKCYDKSPDFGKAVDLYFKDGKASAGQYYVINKLLNNLSFV